jgi:hypothetical protein
MAGIFSRLSLPLESSLWQTMLLSICIGTLVGGSVLAAWLSGADWAGMLRDSEATGNEATYAGLISNFGILIMTLTALMCLLVAVRGGKDWALLLVFGLFATGFALDDGLMLHEKLGHQEWLYFLAHGGMFLTVIGLSMWRQRRVMVWPILAIGSLFSLSVLVDLFWKTIHPVMVAIGLAVTDYSHTFFEDVPKLIGIVLFAVVALSEAWRAARAPRV